MRKKKRCLTLLEVAIALFLTGILLSSLWGIYRHFFTAYLKTQKEQVKAHKILFLKQKLDKIGFLIANSSLKENLEGFFFTPSEKGLLSFSYENHPDPEASFNGWVKSTLFMDGQTLCLATWSYKKQARIETLLDKVQKITLSYFDPQIATYRTEWPKTMDHLPLWIKFEIKTEELIEFQVKVTQSKDPIIYIDSSGGFS